MSSTTRKFRNIRRRKRSFHGNRFTKEEEPVISEVEEEVTEANHPGCEESLGPSDVEMEESVRGDNLLPISASKITVVEEDNSDCFDVDVVQGNRIFDMEILLDVFSIVCCPICKQASLKIVETCKFGLASSMIVFCARENCTFSKEFNTSKKIGHSYEINKRIVLVSRNVGIGHQGLGKVLSVLNLPPPMNKSAYKDSVQTLCNAAKKVAETSMRNAVSQTKELYEGGEDGIVNIAVSGDGTWRKRGYTSSIGITSVLSLANGKVLDTEIMSRECKSCMLNTRKEGSKEFENWWEIHKHVCEVNFHGSSSAMDPEGCLRIFQRSIDKYGARYVEFLGDGDSKAHKLLLEKEVYGDLMVKKLECIGHIQKRMGSRLRALKKRSGKAPLHDGKSIGGKGRLTDKLIDSLQVYYGRAIRNNLQSTELMKNAVMAIWNHKRSTDEKPHHELCPKGSNSWCGYQRDIANKQSKYQHDNPLPIAVASAIQPVFEALSDESLLKACLHGGTQNQNEAFNSLIWQRAPKRTHSGLPTVQTALYLAIGIFNDGGRTILDVLEELGIAPGNYCVSFYKQLDKRRLYHAAYKSSEKAKIRRKTLRNRKRGYFDKDHETEGAQYESGAF